MRCLSYGHEVDEDEEDLKELKENKFTVKSEVNNVKTDVEHLMVERPAVVDHDYESPQNTDISTSDDTMHSANDRKLSFKDKNELMDYITKNLTVDELFEKLTQAEEESLKRKELITKVVKSVGFNGFFNEYFAVDKSQKLSAEQSALISSILTEISKLMQSNKNVKHKVLEILSEKHSKDFLDHALQENSTTVVCDKITIPNVVNYLIHKVNIAETGENDIEINKMNRSMIHHLVNNSHNAGKEIVSNKKELHELMRVLFKSTPKMEIFDIVHEFLRKVLQNN